MSFFATRMDTNEVVDAFAIPPSTGVALRKAQSLQCVGCFNRVTYVKTHPRVGAVENVRPHFSAVVPHALDCPVKSESDASAKARETLLSGLEKNATIVFNLNVPTGYDERHFSLQALPTENGMGYEAFKHKRALPVVALPVPSVHELLVQLERVKNWQAARGIVPNGGNIFVNTSGIVMPLSTFVLDEQPKQIAHIRNIFNTHAVNCSSPRLFVFTPAQSSMDRVAQGAYAAGKPLPDKKFKSKPLYLNYHDPMGAEVFLTLSHKNPKRLDPAFVQPVAMATISLQTKRIAVLAYPVLWGQHKGHVPNLNACFATLNLFDMRQMACLAQTDILEATRLLSSPPAETFDVLLKGGKTHSKNLNVRTKSKKPKGQVQKGQFGFTL